MTTRLPRAAPEHAPAPVATLTPRFARPASLAAPIDRSIEALCFDRFVLTPSARLLTKDGRPVDIGGRGFDLLLALLEEPGRVIPKRNLVERVWPDVVVEEVTLRFHMTRLRKLLNDGDSGVRLIATQVGVGYAFVGAVTRSRRGAVGPSPRRIRPDLGLPARPERLVGRDGDVGSLVARSGAARLLTVVGAPGVGKTSVAIETAHRLAPGFAEGALFVDLSAVDRADGPAHAVAEALGLGAGDDPTARVLAYLRDQQRLLVLDTCEHVVQAAASLAEQIATAAPEVRMLATSRRPLRARAEHIHRLSPHDLPDDRLGRDQGTATEASAIELFLHHAAIAGGSFDRSPETLRLVADICRRVGGLAMAIERAADRAASHGLAATAREVGDSQMLLWPGHRTAPPRQRTLRASLDWSYGLLSPSGRRVFDAVAARESPFTLEAALGAAADGKLTPALIGLAIDELAEHALLLPRDGEYACPDIVRLYAREHPGPTANKDQACGA